MRDGSCLQARGKTLTRNRIYQHLGLGIASQCVLFEPPIYSILLWWPELTGIGSINSLPFIFYPGSLVLVSWIISSCPFSHYTLVDEHESLLSITRTFQSNSSKWILSSLWKDFWCLYLSLPPDSSLDKSCYFLSEEAQRALSPVLIQAVHLSKSITVDRWEGPEAQGSLLGSSDVTRLSQASSSTCKDGLSIYWSI